MKNYNPENYEMVSSGYLKINSDGSVSITDKYKNYVKTKLLESGVNAAISVNGNTMTIINNSYLPCAKSADSGVTKIEWLSFNRFKLYLDNDLSNKVVAGAGIAASLAVWIPDPTVAKIVACALGASAGLIQFNNHGKGVIISGMYNTPATAVIFYWIKPQ